MNGQEVLSMSKSYIGMMGLGVMGRNLAINMASKGFSVSGYDINKDSVDNFNKTVSGIKAYSDLNEFTESLESPKKIMLMVPSGKPVDDAIEHILPSLSKGDIIIDGGNSFFKDTIRRHNYLKEKGIYFIGSGVSGGEEGARKGPALMPGGDAEAYKYIEPIFNKIAAQVDNTPCSIHIGPDGAGHFVKMVHNGIEYGDMELISESYFLMRYMLKLSIEEIQKVFEEWNKGELNSYLIEITSEILKKYDEETGKPMVDIILDKAGQKGTGKWTTQVALDLGISIPTIASAVFARFISAIKDERVRASKEFNISTDEFTGDKDKFIEYIKDALYLSKIVSYAQGFAIMKSASEEYNWNLNLGNIALIWRGGCIIRAKFLNKIKDAYAKNPDLNNLLLDEYFKNSIEAKHQNWRYVVSESIKSGYPVPAFSSALNYFDSYRSEILPANMIQAQRDFFGAHTYERIDKPGKFHTNWQ